MVSSVVELQRISGAQMQARADYLLSLPDSLPDRRPRTAVVSPPPGPPSSVTDDAEPASLPPDSPACSSTEAAGQHVVAQDVRLMELGRAPLSWAEADRVFYASASAQANVATSAAGPSGSAAGPSGSSAAQESVQLVEPFSGAVLETFSLAQLKRPAPPVQTPRKEAPTTTKRGDRQTARPASKRERSSSLAVCLSVSRTAERRSGWIQELAQR